MKPPDQDKLITPIYLKTRPEMNLPEDRCYYLVTGTGVFIGRNTPDFQSLVPAKQPPKELATQETYLSLNYPKLDHRSLEKVVGFFGLLAERHGAEAGVLLAWDRAKRCFHFIVPRQVATVGETWRGEHYPIGLRYDLPAKLSSDLQIVGDIHSHASHPSYASWTDQQDEEHRPGLHIVAGRLQLEPPDWHVEFVVDGSRVEVPADEIMDLDRYRERDLNVPQSWLDCVTVQVYTSPPVYKGPGYSSYSSPSSPPGLVRDASPREIPPDRPGETPGNPPGGDNGRAIYDNGNPPKTEPEDHLPPEADTGKGDAT